MKKISTYFSCISIMISVMAFSFLLCGIFNKVGLKSTSGAAIEYDKLSNKKICWGIKRADNHEQPDVGKENIELMKKYNGIYMGNSEKKVVYLTFDAGYEAGYTEKILEVLKDNNVTATFFITGHYLNTQPDLIQKMIDNGNIIGNHTVNHKCQTEISLDEVREEIMNLHTAVYEKFGYEMKYFRPPKGEFSERTMSYINSLGYTSALWSLAYDDWDENKQGREEYAKKKILDNIHNGAVILLHSNSKDNSMILDSVIKEIKAKGYKIKSLDEYEE